MYIDELRPNIWVVDSSSNNTLETKRDNYDSKYKQNNYQQGFPGPIIIGPNPMPPFVIGGGGYPTPFNPEQQPSGQTGGPTTPPPSFTPQKQVSSGPSLYKIDAGGIKGCMYRWVYIWPANGSRGYWIFITYVGRKSIAGYRYNGYRYVYGGVDLNSIESFECY